MPSDKVNVRIEIESREVKWHKLFIRRNKETCVECNEPNRVEIIEMRGILERFSSNSELVIGREEEDYNEIE